MSTLMMIVLIVATLLVFVAAKACESVRLMECLRLLSNRSLKLEAEIDRLEMKIRDMEKKNEEEKGSVSESESRAR